MGGKMTSADPIVKGRVRMTQAIAGGKEATKDA